MTAARVAKLVIECQGARERADTSNTAPKWTTVGVAKAGPASSAWTGGRSATRVITTNCNPMSAPAAEPTMTQKLSQWASPGMRSSEFLETLETIRQFGSVLALVGELPHQQRERLEITRDSQRPRIDGIESDVA